jgi:DNA repair exonuclease SbcCD nuclease subunit
MPVPRFIHAADIHLDSPLRGLETYEGAPVEQIRGASRHALSGMIQLALDQQVDFVIIAGDLYDGDWRDQQTGLFFASQVAKLRAAKIPIYVIRGNHDAASVITKHLPLADNHDGSPILLSTEAQTVRLEHLGIAIHGQSFGNRAETENLAAGYPHPDRDLFNIGILHTSLSGLEGHDRYAPCTPTELIDKGYDYWALGHIHTRGEHQPDGETPIVFPGNLQGRNIRETGPKGCVVVDVDPQGHTARQFHPLDLVRWEVCDFDAESFEDPDEILASFATQAEQMMAASDAETLVLRVQLKGQSSWHDHWTRKRDHYEALLRNRAIEIAGSRIWMQSLKLRTRDAASDDDGDAGDGPIDSVKEIFRDLERGVFDDETLNKELAAVEAKLSANLVDVNLHDLSAEARTGLLARLRGAAAVESTS